MNFDIIQKILQKKGGYPNEILKTIMQVINLTKYEFLKSMIDKFGKKGAEQFIQQSLRNMSKQGKIRINAGNLSAPGYEKDSFIELDLDNVNAKIVDLENEFYATVELKNWIISDSNIVFEDEDGNIQIFDIDGFLSEINDLDSSDYYEGINVLEGDIEDELEKILGVKVDLEYLPERRE